MLESKVEKDSCKYARSKGFLTYKFKSPANNGVPDRIFMRKGVVFFIEFKKKDKELRLLQEKVCEKIIKEGGIACYVIDSYEKAVHIINSYDK